MTQSKKDFDKLFGVRFATLFPDQGKSMALSAAKDLFERNRTNVDDPEFQTIRYYLGSSLVESLLALERDSLPLLHHMMELLSYHDDRVVLSDVRLHRNLIAWIDKLGPDALPACLYCLNSERPGVRKYARDFIDKLGDRVAEPILRAIASPEWAIASNAMKLLINYRTALPEAPKSLARMIGEADDNRSAAAAKTLQAWGNDGISAMPVLIDLFRHKSPKRRTTAAEVCVRYGTKAVPELIKALNDDDSVRLRSVAAYALGRLGKRAVDARLSLVERMDDPNDEVKIAAIKALKEIGIEEELDVMIMAKQLKNRDEAVRLAVLETLGDLGDIAKPARKLVDEVAKNDPSQMVRDRAESLLSQWEVKP